MSSERQETQHVRQYTPFGRVGRQPVIWSQPGAEPTMDISERASQGFLLAATVARDRGAIRADAGLSDSTKEAWTAAARDFVRLARAERDRTLASIAAGRPLLHADAAGMSARAMCLLAASCDPDLGHTLLEAGPLPRPGYVGEPALLRLLYRCVPDRPDPGLRAPVHSEDKR